MKYILVLALVFSSLFSNSLILDIGANSNHLVKGNFNEKHSWKGIGYRFIEKDKYSVQVKYVSFVNSYFDDTEFLAIQGIYTPFVYKKVKLGISGSIGGQKGYYVTRKDGTVNPSSAKRLGIENKSILILYSLYAEFDNVVFNYTYIPGSVEAMTIGFKAVEW